MSYSIGLYISNLEINLSKKILKSPIDKQAILIWKKKLLSGSSKKLIFQLKYFEKYIFDSYQNIASFLSNENLSDKSYLLDLFKIL